MATKINPKKYLPILNIPEGKSGEWEIQHEVVKKGQAAMLNNFRASIFRGSSLPHAVKFDRDVRFHNLLENGRRWTSDLPIEQVQQYEDVKGLRGHVLVGGLGIGMIAAYLARNKSITAVTVVEIEKDVINLVAPHIRDPKISVVHEDLFDYLKRAKTMIGTGKGQIKPFTCAFYDIWGSDGEATFFNVVCPLIELSHGVVRGEVRNWNEGVMRGQLRSSLYTRRMIYTAVKTPQFFPEMAKQYANMPPLTLELDKGVYGDGYDVIFHNWSVPFFQWVEKTNSDDELFNLAMEYYVSLYGRHHWLNRWEFCVEHILTKGASL